MNFGFQENVPSVRSTGSRQFDFYRPSDLKQDAVPSNAFHLPFGNPQRALVATPRGSIRIFAMTTDGVTVSVGSFEIPSCLFFDLPLVLVDFYGWSWCSLLDTSSYNSYHGFESVD